MSLPFRFKAGESGGTSMAAVLPIQHHHRSTTKIDHKSFKSKHATKSALKDRAKGKIEREDRGKRRTPHQQVMSKLERRNKAKQLRLNHKEKQDHETAIFQGINGAAKHIAVIPLSKDIDVRKVIQAMTLSVGAEGHFESDGPTLVTIERFKRNLLFIPSTVDLVHTMDVCKVADWVLFLMKADQDFSEDQELIIRATEGQGITTVAAMVTDLEEKTPVNKRSKQITDLKAAFSRYFADLDKLSVLENKSDCANLVRSFCTASSKGVRWRDDRSWMWIEGIRWNVDPSSETVTPVLNGTLRGKGLNLDRLIHVQGWGEYKIKQVREVRPQVHKRKANEMEFEQDIRQWTPSSAQEELIDLAPEEIHMTDVSSTVVSTEHKGVLLDDHHYFSDDNSHIPEKPKKLPKGTSSYQAAWFLDDVSDSDSDVIDDDGTENDVVLQDADFKPEDGAFIDSTDMMTEAGGTEYPDTEMHVDVNEEEETRQLEEFRASRKKEAEEDLEFPDEIELHPNVLARERLAKYRGLKSLRTSEWNTSEDRPYEPQDYQRLLQVPDYKKSYSAAVKDALVGGIPAGTKVEIELEEVPSGFQSQPAPTSMFSLLRHEHKRAVINLNVTLSSHVSDPIKSKEELIVQVGHRRFLINPIFSAAGQTPNDVHKFDRFLHPGRSAIATFTGPLTWGSVPVLVFKQRKEAVDHDESHESTTAPNLFDSSKLPRNLELIGTATTVPPSSSRVIAKRVILTGHPFKIHKKLVTIRYMFFNREDVLWFSALPLWTKRGRQGFIKEPLGTHGYFKATFDGVSKVNAMDAVGVSLYKRVWPRPCRRLE